MTPERHSVFLRPPEISASIDLDSEGGTVKNRGRGTICKFNSDTTPRLHDRAIRERLQAEDWNRLYLDKTGIYRPCILISQPKRDEARLVFRCDLAEIDEGVREDKTFL